MSSILAFYSISEEKLFASLEKPEEQFDKSLTDRIRFQSDLFSLDLSKFSDEQLKKSFIHRLSQRKDSERDDDAEIGIALSIVVLIESLGERLADINYSYGMGGNLIETCEKIGFPHLLRSESVLKHVSYESSFGFVSNSEIPELVKKMKTEPDFFPDDLLDDLLPPLREAYKEGKALVTTWG